MHKGQCWFPHTCSAFSRWMVVITRNATAVSADSEDLRAVAGRSHGAQKPRHQASLVSSLQSRCRGRVGTWSSGSRKFRVAPGRHLFERCSYAGVHTELR
jgi:hypothetical protein